MKIAVLIRNFDINAGGAERYCVELTKRLSKIHEVHVFSQHAHQQPSDIVFHRIPQWFKKPRYINQWLFSYLTKRATRNKFNIVHSHDMVTHANIHTLHVPCFRTKWSQATGLNKVLRWILTVISARKLAYLHLENKQMQVLENKHFISVSEYLSKNLVLNYPKLIHHIIIAYPGANQSQQFTGNSSLPKVKEKLGLNDKNFLLLFVANDLNKKGMPTILQALNILNNKHIHVAIAGNGKRNENQIPGVLQKNIHFLGVVKNMTHLYHGADALIHPTLVDTYGMSILEAMSAKLPVIVSNKNYCGFSEHLNNNQALILQDPKDPIELSEKINKLLLNQSLRDSLAENGYKKSQAITWENTVQKTLLAYNTIHKTKKLKI